MKYRKKPVIIDAIQYTGTIENLAICLEFMGIKHEDSYMDGEKFYEYMSNLLEAGLYIDTLEGKMLIGIWDYIIKGIAGEFYPCKENIFNKTYEKV